MRNASGDTGRRLLPMKRCVPLSMEKTMTGKLFRMSDLKYVAKFAEFWAVLAVVAVAAFLVGVTAG